MGFIKIYNAGPLFTRGEIRDRVEEGIELRDISKYGFSVYNPIDAPCNDKSKLPTSADIFNGDIKEVLSSDIVIANLDHEDPGTMAELGIAWALNYAYEVLIDMFPNLPTEVWYDLFNRGIKPKQIEVVAFDLREETAGMYDGVYVPFGRNQFVVGMIEDSGSINKTFTEALSNVIDKR